jgi:hypothetical protein
MADQLYLSLWFPNFRLETLPAVLASVMRQFALISGEKRVHAAAAYPISFSEAPTYQRIFVNDERSAETSDTSASIIETAVAEATEQLHDDMAYEFEMKWKLWTPDSGPGSPNHDPEEDALDPSARLDAIWRPHPQTVKIIGFGPNFDEGSFDQNGHVRVDFGLDYPWVLDQDDDETMESEEIDDEPSVSTPSVVSIEQGRRPSASSGRPTETSRSEAAQYIQRNVEMLLAFTLSVEKNCGISSRLLWTESGEPLAEKLIARLQRLN